MKKIIKPVLITIIILALAGGGLYGGYRYSQSKKTAEVVSLSMYAMDGYWGDSINSYGDVTSDKSQTTYLSSGTEILSVNVQAGDHVNEGDVLMTVKKETQDIKGKELEVEKARQAYVADTVTLERLQNTTPIPEYISSSPDTRTREFLVSKEYRLKQGSTFGEYKEDHLVYEDFYDHSGNITSTIYYDEKGNSLDNTKDTDKINAIVNADHSLFEGYDNYETTEVTVGTFYYNAETGEMIGHEGVDGEGNVVERYNAPKGYTPTQLKDKIEEVSNTLKKHDLDLRKKESELEVMKNTNDNGEILAKVSGTVSKVQNKDNYNNTQPFMIVTATDEYYISGSIGEFYLDSVNVGDTVTISSWDTGLTADAVITYISDTPNTDNNNFYSGDGNTNSSNYEFKASFDRSSGIEIGSAVDITITPAGQEDTGLYISTYFVRKDAGGNYVMKMNADNKLEKVYVKVGKSLWGSMIEIKSGVTMDDYLAFPYGNGAVEGMNCKIVDSFAY